MKCIPCMKDLVRIAIAVFSALVTASLLTHTSSNAGFKSAAPERGYYLTKEIHQGNTALTACAVGYHMASLWGESGRTSRKISGAKVGLLRARLVLASNCGRRRANRK